MCLIGTFRNVVSHIVDLTLLLILSIVASPVHKSKEISRLEDLCSPGTEPNFPSLQYKIIDRPTDSPETGMNS